MKRHNGTKPIQGFRVNIQANSNPFPDGRLEMKSFHLCSFHSYRFKPFVSFESMPELLTKTSGAGKSYGQAGIGIQL
jgi:hypothetical protein